METVAIIATGPSITLEQVRSLLLARQGGNCHLLGISDSYSLFGDNLDHMYSCDPDWWDHHMRWLARVSTDKYTQDAASAQKYGLNHIPGGNGEGLSLKKNFIHFGGNSGYQAINLAYHLGYKRMLLVGYDMRKDEGRSHFFGDHPGKLNRTSSYSNFAKRFSSIAQQCNKIGVKIFNCTPKSALTCFPKSSIKEQLGS